MRKTKLVILPGVRTLNRIGCLLLFLACPTIAFKGQENRDVEPVSKLLSLNEIWFAAEPKRGEICVSDEKTSVSDANSMLETGKHKTDENVRDTRLTRSESRMDRVRRDARSLTRERRSYDFSQRRQDLTDRRDTRVVREDRRLAMPVVRDTRVRGDERRVARLSRNERERQGNRFDRRVRESRERENERLAFKRERENERFAARRERETERFVVRRERETERLVVRREGQGERLGRGMETRDQRVENIARRVMITRERDDLISRQARQMRLNRGIDADRRNNENRVQDRTTARRSLERSRRVHETQKDGRRFDHRSMDSTRRPRHERQGFTVERRSDDTSRRQQDRRASAKATRQPLYRRATESSTDTTSRSVVVRREADRSSVRYQRVIDENNNERRISTLIRTVSPILVKTSITSRPPTDYSVISSNDIPSTTGKFKEMTSWLWKEKDLSGWLEKVNYGSIITTGITCFALYMTTNRKTASY